MSFFSKIGDAAKWAGDRINDAEQWVDDVGHGNVGQQAVPAPELVQKVLNSKGAGGWHEGAGQATQLAADHHTISADIQNLSTGLESVWTGGGAEAAQQRIKVFSDTTAAASQTYTTNGQNLTGLAHGFDEMKAALQPMPGTPPHKDFIDVATPWDTDTEDKINQYNQLAQQNLDRYNGYAQQAQNSGQSLKTDYGKLNEFDGTVTITQPGKVKREKLTRTTKNTTGDDKTSTSQSEVDARHITTPPPTTPPPTTPPPNIPPPTVLPPPTGRPVVPPEQRPPRDEDRPGRRPGDDDDTHTSSDLDDPRVTPPGQRFPVGSGNPSWSATGGGDGFGPGGFGVGVGAGAGAGGAGAFGGRGGAGTGTGSRLGGGAGTGAFGEEGGRGGALAGRGAAAGAAGAKGTPGMGGMGAAGNKGKGEEDAEHQRKYGIDDDSAFSLLDDEDGRLLDPHTGLPPTPPTIGA
ncbi:hypothetical protein [Amycolatopsis sp. NPDC051372]|uniref:hypothetical protein n=1 Tax=Amycolatopsis sp. NPDC051372 TaxID=3155669 RepID=UPI003443E396